MNIENLTALSSSTQDPYMALSRIKEYTGSPFRFFKNYILGEWPEFKTTENMALGSALHRGLEVMYSGEAMNEGYIINQMCEMIDDWPEKDLDPAFDRERVKKNTISAYYTIHAYLPEFDEVFFTEQWINTLYTHVDDQEAVLSLLGIIDIAGRDDGTTFIADWKTCTQTNESIEDVPTYMVQAIIYYVLYFGKTGEAPDEFRIYELKKTNNVPWVKYLQDYPKGKAKEGDVKPYKGKQLEKLQEDGIVQLVEEKHPQVNELRLIYTDYLWLFDVVDYMIKAITVNLAEDTNYPVPNFTDRMNGYEEWDYFLTYFKDYVRPMYLERLNEQYAQVREDYKEHEQINI